MMHCMQLHSMHTPWDHLPPHYCLHQNCRSHLGLVEQDLQSVVGWVALNHLLMLSHLACGAEAHILQPLQAKLVTGGSKHL